MKRFGSLLVLLLLSACTVTVVPNRVIVTPDELTVRPGQAVTLAAEPNYTTDSDILWGLGPGDNRNPGDVLEPRVGPTTSYTAPLEPGVYTVYAETIDDAPVIRGSAEITVDPFLDAERFNATTDNATPVLSGNLAPGASRYLIVDVSSSVAASGQALILELGQPLRLTVYDSGEDRAPYASSTSSAFFAEGLDGLVSAGLETEGIGVARLCRGACVIRDAAAGANFVRITNQTNAAFTYTFFAYVGNYDDTGEPQNNDRATAIALSDVDQGAIERLGDPDYYRVAAAGRFQFTAPAASSAIQSRLRADVTNNDDGSVQTLMPGDAPVRVFPGDTVHVFIEDGEYAGAAAVSRYVVEILPTQ